MSPESTQRPVCPESTIESANRRNFVKSAALASVALSLGGAMLSNQDGSPESSASSANTVSGCYLVANVDVCSAGNIFAAKNVVADYASTNNGASLRPGLVFGGPPCVCNSGEGISSNQNDAVCACYPGRNTCFCVNAHGLDFYTGNKKQMILNNYGRLALGGICPENALLSVKTCSTMRGVYVCASQSNAVQASSKCEIGVLGISTKSSGVLGQSSSGSGVQGSGYSGVDGIGSHFGVYANVYCKAGVPLVARGTQGQTGHLQEWRNGSCVTLDVVDAAGNFGINTVTPRTP